MYSIYVIIAHVYLTWDAGVDGGAGTSVQCVCVYVCVGVFIENGLSLSGCDLTHIVSTDRPK